MDLRGIYTVRSALKARFRRYHIRPIWSTFGVCLLQDLTGMFAILLENQRSGGRSENRSGFALKMRIERYNFYFYLTETWEPISGPSFALISYQRSKNIHVNRLSSHLRILIFLSYLGGRGGGWSNLSYPGHMPIHQSAQPSISIFHQPSNSGCVKNTLYQG